MMIPVLRIRDVFPGSYFFLSRIPDPNCLHPGSASKNISILTPKKTIKWFLSSTKYDPGCSFWIRMLTFYPSRISDPGSRGQKGTGSATLGDPQHWFCLYRSVSDLVCHKNKCTKFQESLLRPLRGWSPLREENRGLGQGDTSLLLHLLLWTP